MQLTKKAVLGVKWSSISQFGRQAIQYTTTIILASILAPADFGLLAMALIFIGFLELFKDMGFAAAVIHKDDINDRVLSTIFWTILFIGLILSVVIFFTSPIVAAFYENLKLIDILKSLSIVFLLSSLTIIQKALLEKKLLFTVLAKIELFAVLTGAVVGITMALTGFGVWSLVFQAISNALVSSILLWGSGIFYPKFVFDFNEVKNLSSYSLNLAGYNFLNYFVRNADYLFIGKFLGGAELGHYFLAYKIMLYPVQSVTQVISRVFFPLYSSIKNDLQKFRNVYQKVCNSIAIITFPLMLGLIAISTPFISLFFNEKWDNNLLVQLLTILAPVGLIQSIAATTGPIFMSTGKTKYLFYWGIISGIIYIGGFYIGIYYGAVGVAVSYLITTLILLYPVFALPFKIIKLSTLKFFISFKEIFFSSIIMLVVSLIIKSLVLETFSSTVQLIILIPLSVVIYFSLLWVFKKELLLEVIKTFRKGNVTV